MPIGSKTSSVCSRTRVPTDQHMEAYFAHRGWPVLDFQRRAWAAYGRGASGLIHAPTGSGKTLAAWGGAAEELLGNGPSGEG